MKRLYFGEHLKKNFEDLFLGGRKLKDFFEDPFLSWMGKLMQNVSFVNH